MKEQPRSVGEQDHGDAPRGLRLGARRLLRCPLVHRLQGDDFASAGSTRDYFNPEVWALLAFTNGSFVRFVMTKRRQRRLEQSRPPAKDFGT